MLNRRQVLKVGALGTTLTLSNYLRLASAGEAGSHDRSAILVFLQGGPSHQDMFDLKPEAPAEYRGQFRPIKTNVDGVEISQHLPKLAACADKYAILRGVTHNLAEHGLGTRYMMTGNRPIPTLQFPSHGAVVSREHPSRPDMPTSVAIDEDIEGAGYLGTQYAALATGEKPRGGRPFSIRGVTLGDGVDIAQVNRRQQLARDVDTLFNGYEQLDDQVKSLHRFKEQAYEIISSKRSREAFDLTLEADSVVNRFGTHECGQSMLLAVRLIEAGVRFVTVIVDGWDTHNDNFKELQTKLLPELDQGLSAMLSSLDERGLLESTTVLTTGEFGRTPKVNGNSGRDHWARASFALMAGGDVRGGQVLGETDDKAAEPVGTGFTPDDIAASLFHNLGIDHQKEYHTNTGRPVMLVRDGAVIRQLFG